MARQELTTNGLKLYRVQDGTHWLQLGENAAFCLENISGSEIVTEQVKLWVAAQVPVKVVR
jgi:hypothetical protein